MRIGEGGGKGCNCKQSEERLPEKAVHEESLKSVQNRSQQQEQGPRGGGTLGMMKQRGGEEHRSPTNPGGQCHTFGS